MSSSSSSLSLLNADAKAVVLETARPILRDACEVPAAAAAAADGLDAPVPALLLFTAGAAVAPGRRGVRISGEEGIPAATSASSM